MSDDGNNDAAVAATDADTDESDFKFLWGERCDIYNTCRLSSSYHRKREQFFTLADRWDKIATLILGTAAFTQVVAEGYRNVLTLAFAVLASASLVFDFSERARKHAELATKFKLLQAEIDAKGKRRFEESDISSWAAKIAVIESGEPPYFCALIRLCQNEIARADGKPQDIYKLSWVNRWLAHIWPFTDCAMANEEPRERI